MQGLSSGRFLEIVPKQFTKELPPPTGGPVGGGDFKYDKYNQGGSESVFFNREFQEGVGLMSFIGAGVCPKKATVQYADSPGVHTDFLDYEDLERYSHGKIKFDEIQVRHSINFPKSLLQRMNAIYEVQNKPNDAVMDGLLKGFFEQRKQQTPITK